MDSSLSEFICCVRRPGRSTEIEQTHATMDEVAETLAMVVGSTGAAKLNAANCFDFGFLLVDHGVDESGVGFLNMVAQDKPVSFSDLNKVLAHLDDFIDSDCARRGFTLQCDLRELQWPPLDFVWHCKDWGLAPERMEKWPRYTTLCTTIMHSGVKYWLLKSILIPTLHMCQPACKVYLLTDDHKSKEDAIIFDPCQPSLTQVYVGAEQIQSQNAQDKISETLNINSVSDLMEENNLSPSPSGWTANLFKDDLAGIKTFASDQGIPSGTTFSEWRLHAAQDNADGEAWFLTNHHRIAPRNGWDSPGK